MHNLISSLFKKLKSLTKYSSYPLILMAIIFVGFVLRIYKAPEYFMYSHDNDLAGWIIKDIVVNRHFRLIGQETSNQGVFIGPLFYYLQIPFFLLTNMDPIGGVYLTMILGLFTIFSFYYCLKNIFNKNAGLIGALVYSVSFYTVFGDREVVPTMPIFLWSVWFFYALHLVLKGNQRAGFLISAILLGLVWHINSGLSIFSPLVILAFFLSKKRLDIKSMVLSFILIILILSPLFLFEYKHGFIQTKSILSSFGQTKDVIQGLDKVDRVLHLLSKDLANLFTGPLPRVNYSLILTIFVLVFVYLYKNKNLERNITLLMLSWLGLIVVFFSKVAIVLSEYYLNASIVIWVCLFSLMIAKLIEETKYRYIGLAIIFIFVLLNFYRFATYPVNRSGYTERKAIVEEIKRDSEIHKYPCISISYIADPGYDLGYRYFFYLNRMHVNRPSSGSPVYTIVFPLKEMFKTDVDFGAIGLIYPDYKRYSLQNVNQSCSGANSNLTDPMFGYVE